MLNKLIIFIVFLFSFFIPSAYADINGNVTDAKTNEPIALVNVVADGKGVSTDEFGNFSIDVPFEAFLKFSHIGYETTSIKAENAMVIRLIPKFINAKEIVVYSGLIEESIQKTSHNVSIIGASELKRTQYDHFQSLTNQITNLNWVGGTSRPRYFQIRGIGERSQYFGEGAPNFSIGFILDDMELSGLGMLGSLFDLNQIEVFRGPMSSIFGSNSLAGLISLRSNDPSESLEMKSSFSLGMDNYSLVSSMLNLPLGSKLRIRIVGSYNYSDGFRKNKYKKLNDSNKRDEQFYRFKLKYELSKKFNILGSFIYADMNNGYDAWAPDNNKQYNTYSDDLGEDSQQTLGGSIRFNLKTANSLKFTSISSVTQTDLIHSYDGDWANDNYWYDNHGFDSQVEGWSYNFYDKNDRERNSISQDIRVSYNNFILGAYYKSLVESDLANGYLFGGLATKANSKYDFEVYSGYFKYNREIYRKVKLSTSIRLEKNNIDYVGNSTGMNYYYEPIELPDVQHSNSYDMNGYRLSLLFKKNQAMNYFGSIAKGYKSGGVNQQPYINDINRNYGPEALHTIEIGMKYFTNPININFNLFYGIREDQQISISSQQVEGDPNSFIFYATNAGSGSISGIEFESKIELSQNTSLNLSASYLDTWIDEFTYNIADSVQMSGGNREAATAPKLSGSLNVQYLGKWGLKSILTTSFKSEYYYSDSHNNKSDAHSVTDLSISKDIGKNLIFKIWGRNIFDERYSTRGFYFGLVPPNYTDQLFKSYADPRQFGFSVTYEL